MNRFSKRTLLAGAAPLALATILGGSVAFAANLSGSGPAATGAGVVNQQADPTPAPTKPASPASPTTPGERNHDGTNCPNMGGSGGTNNGSGGTAQSTSFRGRGAAPSSAIY